MHVVFKQSKNTENMKLEGAKKLLFTSKELINPINIVKENLRSIFFNAQDYIKSIIYCLNGNF